MIVVASNDNESPQVTLPGFSICVPVPVIRGLGRFLTSEVVEVEDGVVIIPVWQFFSGALAREARQRSTMGKKMK